MKLLNKAWLKTPIRKLCNLVIRNYTSQLAHNDLRASAVVFSPHPDDETLGCGVTIFRKKTVGAEVKIVFMTDGANSHSHLISGEQLKAIRRDEACAATRKLGLNNDDLIFLDFKDGGLTENKDGAIRNVVQILLEKKPQQLFIPYFRDPLPDHIATNMIVHAALKQYPATISIFEYPIWFWFHWPWASIPISRGCQVLRVLRRTLSSLVLLLFHFKSSVYIKDHLDVKRAALREHKSQMVRLLSDSRWKTLSDISEGEFLECFFQDYEIFYRHSHGV